MTNVSKLGLLLLSLGGYLNLLERWLNNCCVHDYLNFFGLFSFNIYDVMVDLGLVLLVYSILTNKDDKPTGKDI